MGLFVESNMETEELNLSDIGILCQQLEIAETDFYHLFDVMQQAINTLTSEYGINGDSEDCPICNMSEDELFQYLRDLVSMFRENPNLSYDLEEYYNMVMEPGDDYGPCERPGMALLCITACAGGSNGVIPLMMICGYMCICEYCPNNPLCAAQSNYIER
jgi:hypothetical protein